MVYAPKHEPFEVEKCEREVDLENRMNLYVKGNVPVSQIEGSSEARPVCNAVATKVT